MFDRPISATLLLPAAILLSASSFVACKSEPRPDVVVRVPTVIDASVPDSDVRPADPVDVRPSEPNWRQPALAESGPVYSLVRTDEHLTIARAGLRLVIAHPTLGDCHEELPQPELPLSMPERDLRERHSWLTLRGDDGQAAAVRLSTHGAQLLVDDGCLRIADLTPALLGSGEGAADPLFTASQVAPLDAINDEGFSLVEDGSATSIHADGLPIVTVSHFPGSRTLTARQTDDQRWFRLLIADEHETDRGQSIVGREHTLVWKWSSAGAQLLLENDYRFGAAGPDQDDARITSMRRHPIADATVIVSGERTTIEDAMNVGAGKCPEMEGVLAFRHVDESVRWAAENAEGKMVTLGQATRRQTVASGCLNIARDEVSGRHRLLADRSAATKVRWKTPTQAVDMTAE